MQTLASTSIKTLFRMARLGISFAAVLAVGTLAQPALAASWSGASAISPALQPDPTRGSQLNDVAVNANGLTVAAWDQYTYNNGGGAAIGIALQSGGRWGTPSTISGNTDIVGAPIGFAMTPRVAIGADGTMAVSWTYQLDPYAQSQIKVAVKQPTSSTWTLHTLATFTPGGVSITRSVPVAVDASGNVTAAWNEWNGTHNVVQAASLPKGANTWSLPSMLSGPTDDGLYLSLAVNARGDAGVVYSLSPYSSYPNGTSARYVSRSGPTGVWTAPVTVSETISSSVGYVTNPQVALDANGYATVIYMGTGVEGTRQLNNGWTVPQAVIQAPNQVSSYQSIDLGMDQAGNAVIAASIFDATINVDRASVWVAQGSSGGAWSSQQRITDPTVPVDAYATRVAVSPDGTLALVGWIDHYHGTARVAQRSGINWNMTTIGRGTAFSSFQEVLSLDAGSGTGARAIWKSSKNGTKILAASYR